MSRCVLPLAFASLVLYFVICSVFFYFQRSFLYFPQPRGRERSENVETLRVADVNLMLSVRRHGGTHAVIYFGGNGEDVAETLPYLARAFPECALYLLHYRGYGGSDGSPTEQALHADALALFDHVHAQHERVEVIGRSLGSGVAIRLASRRPVSRLVLVTPYDSIQEIAAARFALLPVRWLLRDKFESWRYAPLIRTPTLLIVAERDDVIPAASSKLLYSRFRPGVAEYRVMRNVGHNSIEEDPNYFSWLAGAR